MSEGKAMERRNRVLSAKRCDARTRKGTFCSHPAGYGTDHLGRGRCRYHGGSTPSQRNHVAQADGVSVCDHDGKATGTLRLNPLRAEVACEHCWVILQVDPPSVAVRFCDAAALVQAFRRAQAKLEAEQIVEGNRRALDP
jgi:hypothetical protein